MHNTLQVASLGRVIDDVLCILLAVAYYAKLTLSSHVHALSSISTKQITLFSIMDVLLLKNIRLSINH